MANLVDSISFDAIYQIEITDAVSGGPAGIANVQPQQLANRTAYLKDITDNGRMATAAGGFNEATPPVSLDRGRFVVKQGGAGVPDKGFLAIKLGDDTYSWQQLF